MNRSLRLLSFALLFSLILTSAAQAQNKKKKKKKKDTGPPAIKALLITGGCCHDYVNQVQILTQGISQRAKVQWEVFRGFDGKDRQLPIYQTEDWAKGYDVIVHNECYGGTTDVEAVERIVNGHKKHGVPLVAIHCSMHSYRNAKTDVWRNLLGVTSMRHEKHSKSLEVVNRASDHPIMKAFGASWATPAGELYVIEKAWPDCKPLATAYAVQGKRDETVIWINDVDNTRVFGTTLGHHNETMLCDEYLDVVTRGLLWSCKKLNDDGTPASGYEGTGESEIILPSMLKNLVPGPSPTLASWSDSVKFPGSEKPTELFNGRDLSGWKGNMKYWSVKDGIIVAKNSAEDAPKASTYLLTKKDYRNFRLVFEGKLVTSKMHSGVSLWGKAVEKAGDPNSYQGHLVMFPGNYGIWDLYRRNSIYKDDGRAKKAGKVGDWNRFEILAIDSTIRLAVNGKEVADWTDPKPELCGSGPIGLQLHSNKVAQEVQFRGLRLSENPVDRLITADSDK